MVKIKFLQRYFLLTVALFMLTACPEEVGVYDLKIKVINNSGDKVILYSKYRTNDTILPNNFPWYSVDDARTIDINSYIYEYSAEETYNSIFSQNSSLHYYIFNYDSVKTIPWELIRDEYIVAKRVDIDSWEDLEACDFTITYP